LKPDAHENNASDNSHHAQGHSENPHDEFPKKKKEKCQQHSVNARQAGNPLVFFFTPTLQKFQKNRQSFQRINNRQERREHPNEQCQFIFHESFFPTAKISISPSS
jgi:hypothetical protein